MLAHHNRFSLQVADNSSLVFRLPLFGFTFLFVAVLCDAMNMWEISLSVGRQAHTDANDLTEGFHLIKSLIYRCGPTRQPSARAEDHWVGKYCIDEIDFGADARQEEIDAWCLLTYSAAWDKGSPQPNSPDILDQVRLVMDDIDEFGASLPY